MLNNPKQLRRLELAIQAIKNSQISFVQKCYASTSFEDIRVSCAIEEICRRLQAM